MNCLMQLGSIIFPRNFIVIINMNVIQYYRDGVRNRRRNELQKFQNDKNKNKNYFNKLIKLFYFTFEL